MRLPEALCSLRTRDFRAFFGAQVNLLRVPRDRDLPVAAGNPRLPLPLGPLAGYGIEAWRLPSLLSALGMLFSIAFVCLLQPLVLRETALTTKETSP